MLRHDDYQNDYMAEDGDMSDVVEDVDEEENDDDDQNIEVHDTVSLVSLFFCYYVTNTVLI